MATNLEQSLERIMRKCHFLTERFRAVSTMRKKAEERVAELEKELTARDKEIQGLRMQLEYLTMATTIAPGRDEVEKTRAMISNIVREIDRCIADLNE